MELVKPDPLIIGGRAHYTLTSYDPVTLEVDVPAITEADVDRAYQIAIMQEGGGPERLADDAWIREKFEGVHGAAELRDMIRRDLQSFSSQMAEQQKAMACANALAERLVQRVPDSEVEKTRQAFEQSFRMSLEQQGSDLQTFMSQNGMTSSDYNAMVDAQANALAQQDAAVSAWADARKIEVSDDEVARLLGMPDDSGLRNNEQARNAARQVKAMEAIMAECSCTYKHDVPPAPEPPSDHPHLKLV